MENDTKSNSICQCCLDDDPPMKNMLTDTYQDVLLIENFHKCSGIDLLESLKTEDIIISKNICQKCENNLKIAIDFRELCQLSQKMLKDRLSFVGVAKEEPISDYEDEEPLVLYTKNGSTRSSTVLTQVFLRNQFELDSKVVLCPKIEEISPTETVIEPEKQEKPVLKDDVDELFNNDDFLPGQDSSSSESEPEEDYSPPTKLVKTETTEAETLELNEEIFKMPALFMCYYCDEVVSTFKKYNEHLKHHEQVINLNSKIKRKCYVCKENVTNYVFHLKEHHKDFKPHTCQRCKRTFHNQLYLKGHLHNHTKTTPFKCRGCGLYFHSRVELRRHIRSTRHSSFKYDCMDCGLGFKEFTTLHEHFLNEHYQKQYTEDTKKMFPCYDCKGVFRQKQFALKHTCDPVKKKKYNVVKRKKSYTVKCQDCRKKFQNNDELVCHKFTYCTSIRKDKEGNTIVVHNCSQCDEEFASNEEVLTHQSTLCQKSFLCKIPGCGTRYKNQNYRNRHYNRMHRVHIKPDYDETAICDTCGATLKNKSSLAKHKNVMHNPKYVKKIDYFTCSEPDCGKVVHSKHAFECHLRLHLEKRPLFECYLCPRKFRSLTTIRGHVVGHASDPDSLLNFVCDFCHRKFVDQPSLNVHRTSHILSSKPLNCGYCSKSFNKPAHLKNHVKRIHEGIYYECCHCKFYFATNAAMRIHLHDHEGFRPYRCSACPEQFFKRYVFTQHLNKHGIQYDNSVHCYEYEVHSEDMKNLIKSCKRLGQMPKNPNQPQRQRFKRK